MKEREVERGSFNIPLLNHYHTLSQNYITITPQNQTLNPERVSIVSRPYAFQLEAYRKTSNSPSPRNLDQRERGEERESGVERGRGEGRMGRRREEDRTGRRGGERIENRKRK